MQSVKIAYGPAHEISVMIAEVSLALVKFTLLLTYLGARGLRFVLSLHLHSVVVYGSSEGSGFVSHRCSTVRYAPKDHVLAYFTIVIYKKLHLRLYLVYHSRFELFTVLYFTTINLSIWGKCNMDKCAIAGSLIGQIF